MSSRPNFPKLEEEMLAFWEKENIFNKTLEKEAPKGSFVFFEGPPTANGKPGIHHIEARAFKDCMPRFRTMQGYKVERKAGWDTHGLPVELEVEKKLGFTGKKDIEEFGIGEFNKQCKESVWKYLDDWRYITRRIGFWLDLEKPYVTYEPEYIESLWHIIKQVWDRELLYKDYKVVPWCPRCGTGLSSHELAQGYKDVKDLSVTAEFVVKSSACEVLSSDLRTSLLAWTTTPWTLPGNVALAVGSSMIYSVIEKEDEGNEGRVRFVLAKELLPKVFEGSEYDVIAEVKGEELLGTVYEPLYPFMTEQVEGENKTKVEEKAYRVYPADFVTTEDGTGIVHTAVMYGQDDFVLGNEIGLPKHHLVNLDGTFKDGADFLSGRFVKDEQVAIDIIKDLAHRGLLFHKAKYEHSYPHCWRCKTPVIYYARDSWYIRMSSLRDELLENNSQINWEPSHIKDGRFGEWLREVKDWAFSRERYWGTPLPIWECAGCDNKICVGSFEELGSLATKDIGEEFDPHRPYVDDIVLKCDKCSGEAKRVPDVCDVWFDSGSMPFAQWHYPFENKERIDEDVSFPADYISEAIDQTRGWFYTLLAVSTLLGKGAPYKNVICLGHILDADGKKMSKSLGNIVEPNEVIDTYGADAVRWYMYTINQPGESKRFDLKILDEMVKKVFMLLWNVQSFYEMYSDKAEHQTGASPNVLDKWILSRLNTLIKDSTNQLENYKVTEPVRAIGEFINDLSTWYIRRSRGRYKGSDDIDKGYALATTRTCLIEISKLMAPFAPFLADVIYQRMNGSKQSVHLEEWPLVDESLLDDAVLSDMGRTRSIVSRALERRVDAGRSVKQVLAKAIITIPEDELADEFIDVIKDEVNVKEVEIQKGEYAVELDLLLTPDLIREGMIREIIRRVNGMRKKQELSIEDRIMLSITSLDEEVVTALGEHRDALLLGVLANDLMTDGTEYQNTETLKLNECEMQIGFDVLK